MLKWDETYLTGIHFMDEQHSAIIEVANEVSVKIFDCQNIEEEINLSNTILSKLMSHVKQHLQAEEVLMKKHQYPAYVDHKQEHDTFSNHAIQLLKQHHEGYAGLSFPIFMLIKNWFEEHVAVADKRYAEFIKRQKSL